MKESKMSIPAGRADDDQELNLLSLPLELSSHFKCRDSALAKPSQKIRSLRLNSADYFDERCRNFLDSRRNRAPIPAVPGESIKGPVLTQPAGQVQAIKPPSRQIPMHEKERLLDASRLHLDQQGIIFFDPLLNQRFR